LRSLSDLTFHELDPRWLAEVADVVFLALPHLESQRAVPVLRAGGAKVVDLSADYRLRNANDYVEWYKAAHLDPDGLAHAVYRLPSPHRGDGAGAVAARRRGRARGVHPAPRAAQPWTLHHGVGAARHAAQHRRPRAGLSRVLRGRGIRPRARRRPAADDAPGG